MCVLVLDFVILSTIGSDLRTNTYTIEVTRSSLTGLRRKAWPCLARPGQACPGLARAGQARPAQA